MFASSFSRMVVISCAILWFMLTCGLYDKFDALTATLASMGCLHIAWRVAKMMAPLAYGGTGGKALLVLWLVITGIYIGVFDSLVALFLLAVVGAVVWACFWYMLAGRNGNCISRTE